MNKIEVKYPACMGIIPARYESTRFPGKPLIMINGQTMIERVYRQAEKAKCLKQILVATDDERILNHVKGFGGNVVLTKHTHQSGTDRCAEAYVRSQSNCEVVINIQGDEPFLQPSQIDLVASCFAKESTTVATLIKVITEPEEISNPNVVKVVTDAFGSAMYFSRSIIPYNRSQSNDVVYYKHIGIYAYRANILTELTQLDFSQLEAAESLEQLRWLQNGYKIHTAITNLETISIDSPDDLKKINQQQI